MLILQVFAEKRKRDSEDDEERKEDEKKFGMKLRQLQQFFAAHLEGSPMPSEASDVLASIKEAQQEFKQKGLSDFLSTLTPGVQSAIHASSFLWGYENASKYVKNAMKLDSVKNSRNALEKSRAVLEAVQKQASKQNEKLRQSESIIWTFYNESLKDYQAQSSKTETITDKEAVQKMPAQEQASPMPTAQEAVADAISQQSHYHALLYCTNMKEIEHETDAQRLAQHLEQKKEDFAKLVAVQQPVQQKEEQKIPQPAEVKAKTEEKVQQPSAELAVSQEAMKAALARKEELIKEYARAEEALRSATEQLEQIREWDEKRIEGIIYSTLPPSLAQALLKKKDHLRRIILIKQLKKWISFSRKGREELLRVTPARIVKMLSLSSLLKK